MVPTALSASKRFLSASQPKTALFCTYEETGEPCFTQSAIEDAAQPSDSPTFRYMGKSLAGMCKSSFSGRTLELLGLSVDLLESEAEKEDS